MWGTFEWHVNSLSVAYIRKVRASIAEISKSDTCPLQHPVTATYSKYRWELWRTRLVWKFTKPSDKWVSQINWTVQKVRLPTLPMCWTVSHWKGSDVDSCILVFLSMMSAIDSPTSVSNQWYMDVSRQSLIFSTFFAIFIPLIWTFVIWPLTRTSE